MITPKEKEYLDCFQQGLDTVAAHVSGMKAAGPITHLAAWFQHASRVKSILGNLNNPISFMACIMARDFLVKNHGDEAKFDVADKSQSAPGLDIDLKMANGERIIGEVKTTTPCQKGLLGANQKDSIEKDLKKLEDTPANHKYFFVTDPGTYAQVQNQMPQGVEIILLR